MDVTIETIGSRAIAKVTGSYETGASVSEFAKLLAYCKAFAIREVLVDYRALDGKGSATLEIIYAHRVADLYHEFLANGGMPLRFAYLGTTDFINSWVPGLEVAIEAGLDAFVTTDPEKAAEWLDRPGEREA